MPTPKQHQEINECMTAFFHTYSLLQSSAVGQDCICYAILNVALQKITDTHGAQLGVKAAQDILNQHAAKKGLTR